MTKKLTLKENRDGRAGKLSSPGTWVRGSFNCRTRNMVSTFVVHVSTFVTR